MVFVEYQYEVAEEHARLRALLEKLRIEAEVKVFCLSSGKLETYELIIHGISNDIDWEIIVNDTLRDEEWWDDLQMLRGQADVMTEDGVNHLSHIFESTSGRPGIYNPHEDHPEHRRPSVINVSDIPKKPAIGMLSRLGVNVGIHTHHLKDEVFENSDSDNESESDGSRWIVKEQDYDDSVEEIDPRDPVVQPLLSSATCHQSKRSEENISRDAAARGRASREDEASPTTHYGTMSSSQILTMNQDKRVGHETSNETQPSQSRKSHTFPSLLAPDHLEDFPSLVSLDNLKTEATSHSRSASQSRRSTQETIRPAKDGTTTPARPVLSRQSSTVRFSSRPVPETRITSEAEGSKIGFAPPGPGPEASNLDQATFSRHSSFGKFSSRPMPLTRVSGAEDLRTIAFAEQPAVHSSSASHSRHHSRHGSQFSNFAQSETSLSMSEVLQGYKLGGQESGENDRHSVYSTQGVELSFNELPSRAQHLVLNELMRQHSKETAVLLSTLPIPSEGTSLEESSTVQYLSDVEVLCNQLPPTLMVLSNNMTVTVSL